MSASTTPPHALRTLTAVRYVAPLREGGSLPAIVEADDGALYVLKFRGAGQGPKVLIAELLAGAIGRALDLPIPEIVLMQFDAAMGRNERDPEIQALLRASDGMNLALTYLSGALAYEPLHSPGAVGLDASIASAIVWFDAYITNVDRTVRNTNMLLWQQQLWLIDHGAAFYFHYTWDAYLARSQSRFPPIKEHVLLPLASELAAADTRLSARLTVDTLGAIVGSIPGSWLDNGSPFSTPDAQRAAYLDYLTQRLAGPRAFVEEARDAHAQHL